MVQMQAPKSKGKPQFGVDGDGKWHAIAADCPPDGPYKSICGTPLARVGHPGGNTLCLSCLVDGKLLRKQKAYRNNERRDRMRVRPTKGQQSIF